MNLSNDLLFWLLPAPPVLYYLYVTTKAQIVGVSNISEIEIRLAVAALSLVIAYFGLCLLLSDESISRVGISGAVELKSTSLGLLSVIFSAGLAYASKNGQLDSISPWVWAFGMSQDTAGLEISRKSAISAKRRIRQARDEAEDTKEN